MLDLFSDPAWQIDSIAREVFPDILVATYAGIALTGLGRVAYASYISRKNRTSLKRFLNGLNVKIGGVLAVDEQIKTTLENDDYFFKAQFSWSEYGQIIESFDDSIEKIFSKFSDEYADFYAYVEANFRVWHRSVGYLEDIVTDSASRQDVDRTQLLEAYLEARKGLLNVLAAIEEMMRPSARNFQHILSKLKKRPDHEERMPRSGTPWRNFTN